MTTKLSNWRSFCFQYMSDYMYVYHDDVIKWKHFPRYRPFVRGIHRSPVNSPHKGQWRGALMFPLICAWINDWVNNREAGDWRRHRAHTSHCNDPVLSPTPWRRHEVEALSLLLALCDGNRWIPFTSDTQLRYLWWFDRSCDVTAMHHWISRMIPHCMRQHT